MAQPQPDPGNAPRSHWVGDKVDPEEIKPLMRAAKRGDFNASNQEGDADEQRTTGTPQS